MLGARSRREREAERDVALAHTMAIFSRATKLHPLAHYLPRPPADPGSMLGRLTAIASRTGGTIEGVALRGQVDDAHGVAGRA